MEIGEIIRCLLAKCVILICGVGATMAWGTARLKEHTWFQWEHNSRTDHQHTWRRSVWTDHTVRWQRLQGAWPTKTHGGEVGSEDGARDGEETLHSSHWLGDRRRPWPLKTRKRVPSTPLGRIKGIPLRTHIHDTGWLPVMASDGKGHIQQMVCCCYC